MLRAVATGGEDPGVDKARAEGTYADPGTEGRQLVVQGLGDGNRGVLGGVVGPDPWVGGVASHRRSDHHVSGIAVNQATEEGVQAMDDAPQIYAQDPLPIVQSVVHDGPAGGHAGVQADHVGWTECISCPGGEAAH